MTTLQEQQEEFNRAARQLGATIWAVYEPIVKWIAYRLVNLARRHGVTL